jgi:hypothetical protein
LVGEGDQNSAAGSSQFSIENRIQNGIVVLDVLNEKRVAESQGRLEILAEGVIQEAGFGDLPILELVHDELGGLARGI